MSMTLVLLVSLALVVPCFGARLPYIIGGSAVDSATRWPWQCSLGNSEVGHYCGAVRYIVFLPIYFGTSLFFHFSPSSSIHLILSDLGTFLGVVWHYLPF